MGSRNGLDAVEQRKIPNVRRESKSGTPIVQPIAIRHLRKFSEGVE
jgi:hypothetical protein